MESIALKTRKQNSGSEQYDQYNNENTYEQYGASTYDQYDETTRGNVSTSLLQKQAVASSSRYAETAWSKKNIILIVGSVLTIVAVTAGITVGVTKGKTITRRYNCKKVQDPRVTRSNRVSFLDDPFCR